jgi:phytoene dehydrogenase-like protein
MNSIPGDYETFRDWLDAKSDNANVKKLFKGFCAALMGTNPHEIPAGEFFRFLTYSSRGSRFGMAEAGNGEMMGGLADAMVGRGCTIWPSTSCLGIDIDESGVTGVRLHSRDKGEVTVSCRYVLSNTGPQRTVKLVGGRKHFSAEYLEKLDAWPHAAPIFHISFVTKKPLIEGFDGCLVFGNNKNLIYLEIPSLISPQLATDGQYLHTAFGAPSDAGTADLKRELDNTLEELKLNFPGQLDDAQYLVRARHSGDAPGMHRWAGRMMPVTTSIPNLYNVGDGATTPGTIGTEGAAASAKEAVALISGTS